MFLLDEKERKNRVANETTSDGGPLEIPLPPRTLKEVLLERKEEDYIVLGEAEFAGN